MQTTRSERGFLSLSAIVSLLVLASLIFLAFKLLPPYINNYQLQDAIENVARQATYSPMTEQQIRDTVLDEAQEQGIELEPSQVAVRKGRGTVDIVVRYSVLVNLVAREVELSFEPAAGNRNIIMR